MRTLKISFWASLAGWIVGILAGNIGGFLLSLTQYGSHWAWSVLKGMKPQDMLLSELVWAAVVTVGMLPCCAFLVVPVVFLQLGKSSRWHPFPAFCVGGAGGIGALFLWLAVLMLFGTPVNWSRPDDRAGVVMLVTTAFVIGATTGGVAAWLARRHREIEPGPVPPDSLPPPSSYDY